MSLKIAKPTFSLCSLLHTNKYQVKLDDLFHKRIIRAIKLTIDDDSKNKAEIYKILKEAINMKGREYTSNYLLQLKEIGIIQNDDTFNFLVRNIPRCRATVLDGWTQ